MMLVHVSVCAFLRSEISANPAAFERVSHDHCVCLPISANMKVLALHHAARPGKPPVQTVQVTRSAAWAPPCLEQCQLSTLETLVSMTLSVLYSSTRMLASVRTASRVQPDSKVLRASRQAG